LDVNGRIYRTLLLTAAGAAVFVLYFFGRTIPKATIVEGKDSVENHSDHNHPSDVDSETWITLAEETLVQQDQVSLQALKTGNDLSGIAAFWANLNRHDIAALFKQKHASEQSNFKNWDTTGDAAVVAFRNSTDSLQQMYFLNEAIEAYANALLLEEDITTQLKLAKLHTEVTGQTMQGVLLYREVVEKDPEHIQANFELGVLSIRSSQWEKALQRFNTVITANPDFIDAYILKAQSLVGLGRSQEAIEVLDDVRTKTDSPETLNVLDEIKKSILKN